MTRQKSQQQQPITGHDRRFSPVQRLCKRDSFIVPLHPPLVSFAEFLLEFIAFSLPGSHPYNCCTQLFSSSTKFFPFSNGCRPPANVIYFRPRFCFFIITSRTFLLPPPLKSNGFLFRPMIPNTRVYIRKAGTFDNFLWGRGLENILVASKPDRSYTRNVEKIVFIFTSFLFWSSIYEFEIDT